MQKSLQLQKIEAAFSETLSLGEAYALITVLEVFCMDGVQELLQTNPCLLIHSCLLSEINEALLWLAADYTQRFVKVFTAVGMDIWEGAW